MRAWLSPALTMAQTLGLFSIFVCYVFIWASTNGINTFKLRHFLESAQGAWPQFEGQKQQSGGERLETPTQNCTFITIQASTGAGGARRPRGGGRGGVWLIFYPL